LDVHIQGCFEGINYWVRHTEDTVILETEKGIRVNISAKEYKTQVVDFVNKVEDFYKQSIPKKLTDEE
jgi:hypothetical protein